MAKPKQVDKVHDAIDRAAREPHSIMDMCGAGKAYAPKKPVTIAAMNRTVARAAVEKFERSTGRGRR